MKQSKKLKYSLQTINELAEKIIYNQDISLLEIDVLKEKLIEFYSDILYFEKNTDDYKKIMLAGGFISNSSEDQDFSDKNKDDYTENVDEDISYEEKLDENISDKEELDENISYEEELSEDQTEVENNSNINNDKVDFSNSENVLESDNQIIESIEDMEIDLEDPEDKIDLEDPEEESSLEDVDTLEKDIATNNSIEDVENIETSHEYQSNEIKNDLSQEKTDSTVAEKLTKVSSTLHENLAAMEKENYEKSETVADKIRLEKITDIKSAIGINDKFYFINRLFDGDVKFYNETVDKFNNFDSINDAKILLQLLINKYNWDFNDEAYKKFEEIVEKRFEE